MSEPGSTKVASPRATLSLIHHHPGRLRVRAEPLRDLDAAAKVRTALEAEPGITSVAHSPTTGSLLVEYQPGLADPESILARIAGAAGLEPPSEEERQIRREPGLIAIEAAHELNVMVEELTGYRADLRTIVPAGLAALSAYSFVVGKDRLPRWDNLLYWSYNIFAQLHRREIERVGAPPEPPPRAPKPTS